MIEKAIYSMDLETATSQGWEIVGSFETSELLEECEFKEHAHNNQDHQRNYGYPTQPAFDRHGTPIPPGFVKLTSEKIARVTLFRVRKSETSLLAQLNNSLDSLKNSNEQLKTQVKNLTKENEEHEKQIKTLKYDCELGQNTLKEKTTQLDRLREANLKMENALAKILEQIGLKQFAEITK